MEFRWGIIGTGQISTSFAKDLLIDPTTRNVTDVVHKVVAVGSRTRDKAINFVNTVLGGNHDVMAYGSYEGLYADERVDAVYIGTPHTSHYTNAHAALKARKHVLCEKPVTCNAAELRVLLSTAAENGVFFMEAMWTRFQPLALEVKKLVESGTLGAPVVLHADLSYNFKIEKIPKTHRILDPMLGGGALLDLGPYPLVWAILALYENPMNNSARPANVVGSMLKTRLTGVDTSTAFTLTFADSENSGLAAQAILSCCITLSAPEPGVTIRFENGTIEIPPPIFCPKSFKVKFIENGEVVWDEEKTFAYIGGGWHFQADEVARCVRQGKKESDIWGHDKSLLEMEIFDKVRQQAEYKFPDGVEKVV